MGKMNTGLGGRNIATVHAELVVQIIEVVEILKICRRQCDIWEEFENSQEDCLKQV